MDFEEQVKKAVCEYKKRIGYCVPIETEDLIAAFETGYRDGLLINLIDTDSKFFKLKKANDEIIKILNEVQITTK